MGVSWSGHVGGGGGKLESQSEIDGVWFHSVVMR